MTALGWTDTAVWYAVYPLGMTGALHPTDPSEGHRLIRVEGWPDHLVSLGCNGLLLGPIFTSRSHGYDTLDYFSIDPRLGDDADFDSLVAACHARGIRILLDGVFNHVCISSAATGACLTRCPDRRLALHWFIRPTWPIRLNFRGQRRSRPAQSLQPGGGETGRRCASLAGARYRRLAVGRRLCGRAALLGDRAARRARAVPGRAVHRRSDPLRSGPPQGVTLESVTAYELWKAIWSSLNDANFFEPRLDVDQA